MRIKKTSQTTVLQNEIAIDYSTDETKTGYNWIDGKTIYRKCFAIPKAQLGATYVDISHNISNLSLFTHAEGIVKRTDGQFVPLPGNLDNTSYRAFFGDFSTTNMSIKYGSGLYDVIDTIYVVVEYIKSS